MHWGCLPWRWIGRSVAAVLTAGAGALLLVTVRVDAAGGGSASCGSGWDVVAGRSGWQQWWAQDVAHPVGGDRLVRTDGCPDAVNGHIVAAVVLLAAAVVVGAVAAFVDLRRRPRTAPGPARRLRVLGTTVTVVGGLLTAAGLVGIALVTADPSDPLFLYVSRPVVVLIGLLLLLPAVLLVVLGRGASALADQLSRSEASHEPP